MDDGSLTAENRFFYFKGGSIRHLTKNRCYRGRVIMWFEPSALLEQNWMYTACWITNYMQKAGCGHVSGLEETMNHDAVRMGE